jgi:hypothetical protein
MGQCHLPHAAIISLNPKLPTIAVLEEYFQRFPKLDAQQEKQALQVLLKSVQMRIVSAADAMPAVKYGFAATEGEFERVRTW